MKNFKFIKWVAILLLSLSSFEVIAQVGIIDAAPMRAASTVAPDITNGMVAQWKMNEGSGSTAADTSGNGRTMTFSNSPPWAAGQDSVAGHAIGPFNGTSQSGSVGAISQISGATTATLCGWVNRAASAGAAFGQTTNISTRFEIAADSSGNWYCEAENSASASFPHFLQAATGWHFLAMVYDGSQTGLARVTAYFDGAVQTLTAGGLNPGSSLATGSQQGPFFIGYDVQGGFSPSSYDDIRVYNRTLSSSEVTTLFNNGAK